MSRKRILVVDDDQDLVHALQVRLKAAGYEVLFALDAVNAVRLARVEHPDLVILDIGLPAGGGFAVLDRLQKLSGSGVLPVIVLTAREPEGNRDRALGMGAQAYFQKPVESVELLAAVRTAIEGRSGGSRPSRPLPFRTPAPGSREPSCQ